MTFSYAAYATMSDEDLKAHLNELLNHWQERMSEKSAREHRSAINLELIRRESRDPALGCFDTTQLDADLDALDREGEERVREALAADRDAAYLTLLGTREAHESDRADGIRA